VRIWRKLTDVFLRLQEMPEEQQRPPTKTEHGTFFVGHELQDGVAVAFDTRFFLMA